MAWIRYGLFISLLNIITFLYLYNINSNDISSHRGDFVDQQHFAKIPNYTVHIGPGKQDNNTKNDPKFPDQKHNEGSDDASDYDPYSQHKHYNETTNTNKTLPNVTEPHRNQYCQLDCSNLTVQYILHPSRKENLLSIHNTDAFLGKGGKVRRKDAQKFFLCNLLKGFLPTPSFIAPPKNYSDPSNNTIFKQEEIEIDPRYLKYCQSRYIADVIDMAYAIEPIYATRQDQEPMMYNHHRDFVSMLRSIGIPVVVIEGIYPHLRQTFKVTRPGNEPWEIQTHLQDKIFIRENLLNVAIRKVVGWEYLMWIDGHQIFENIYWWEEAIYKMEHYNGVQFFQELVHLKKDTNETDWKMNFPSVMYIWSHTRPVQIYKDRLHIWIGNAWGVRREIYEQMGFIVDYCISGCCDCSYALASMNNMGEWNILDTWPNYKNVLTPWILKTQQIFQGKSAVVRGNIKHLWHERYFNFEGMLKAMMYGDFNPDRDIGRDENFTMYVKSTYWKNLFSTNG